MTRGRPVIPALAFIHFPVPPGKLSHRDRLDLAITLQQIGRAIAAGGLQGSGSVGIPYQERNVMARPVIIALDPFTLDQDAQEQWVMVYGEGFQPWTWKDGHLVGPQVRLDGKEVDTQYLGGDQLRFRVRPGDFAVGDVLAKVRNPDGQDTSWCVPLHIMPPARQPVR